MQKYSERNVRDFLRQNWVGYGYSIDWIEAGRGGTVGLPDVVLKRGDFRMPLELKFWERNSKGLCCKMRPAQRRYHVLEAMAGRRTAILFGEMDKGIWHLNAIPNFAVPLVLHPSGMAYTCLARINGLEDLDVDWDENRNGARDRIFEILQSERFWRDRGLRNGVRQIGRD